jgi:hypothetical protein
MTTAPCFHSGVQPVNAAGARASNIDFRTNWFADDASTAGPDGTPVNDNVASFTMTFVLM